MNDFFVFSSEKLTVRLSANPTTGYQWRYEIDGAILEGKDAFFPSVRNARTVGAVGIWVGEFFPKKDGQTKITFFYQRNWETAPIDTKVLYIFVLDKKIIDVTS